MKPCIVMPLHDPLGLILPKLHGIEAELKALFHLAHISITPATLELHSSLVERLGESAFYRVTIAMDGAGVGEQFLALYQGAVAACPPNQVLHLCFPDRLVFALGSQHRRAFIADVRSITSEETPLLFQRSAGAWATHPSNYREIEGMLSRVGELLFGRTLDFAWCHLAIRSDLLGGVLSLVTRSDMSMLCEIVLALIDDLATRDVDWLAWEDPLIAGEDPGELRASREQSAKETRKRLSYVVPMLDVLSNWAQRRS